MIASIQEGVLVDQVLGLGQGNILSGAFSNPVGLALRSSEARLSGGLKISRCRQYLRPARARGGGQPGNAVGVQLVQPALHFAA